MHHLLSSNIDRDYSINGGFKIKETANKSLLSAGLIPRRLNRPPVCYQNVSEQCMHAAINTRLVRLTSCLFDGFAAACINEFAKKGKKNQVIKYERIRTAF